MTPFDKALDAVGTLVEAFQANDRFFLSQQYQEAEVRKDFIDKFFKAIGWDVDHDEQKNPYEQEVKVERGQRQGAAHKRADYAFSLGPNYRDVRFFVEAKKPHGDLESADNYFQTLRYGWNSHNLVAVLTDFEQIHILDCRYRPSIDTALQRGWKKFHYSQYKDAQKFAEIYWIFSREAVASGSLDPEKLTPLLPKARGKAIQRGLFKGGYQSMDDSFLEELDDHRKTLASAFKNKNAELDSDALTEITQRTIDRLVFIRFLEDRLIEDRYHIEHYGENGTAWGDFIADCRRLDKIYNGIVFKEHQILDSSKFKVDDDAFSGICEDLTHINSPYDFNAIPIHILGNIYERFLGNVIVATDKRAKVEEKPEVRKAGGVYYTPEYIVRYLVENTVGTLIEGKSPAQVAKMTFADISCGSGSFLLGIYDLLLRWHTSYYNEHPTTAKKGDLVQKDDGLHLSLRKRREILLNNIYAVDLDAQAVEVAQLSLYLKLLQEETAGTKQDYQTEFHETLLPSLNKNIVCGNSLIGTDILAGELFEPVAERKLNPMDLDSAFPSVMKSGGFDAIVGNPPYVRIQGFPKLQLDYFSAHFQSARGNFDLYVNFIERGFNLLRPGGLFGQIVPNKFFKTDYGEGLRKLLSDACAAYKIVDFEANQVFEVTTYTCLLFLLKKHNASFQYAVSEANAGALSTLTFRTLPDKALTNGTWIFKDEATTSLYEKLKTKSVPLLELPAAMSRGSSTGDDEVFVVECNSSLEAEILRIPVFATDFGRYHFSANKKWRIIFPYDVSVTGSRLLTERELRERAPKTYLYLKDQVQKLKKRKQYTEWFGYSAPRNLALHDKAQIAVPLLADHGIFSLIPARLRGSLCPMASGGFTITLLESCPVTPEYLLGILNSRLMFWFLHKESNVFRGGWITCTKQYFGMLPIRKIDFNNSEDKTRHDNITNFVCQVVDSESQYEAAKSDKDENYYRSKSLTLERQIDALVYDLYGLTKEEIEIVEGIK